MAGQPSEPSLAQHTSNIDASRITTTFGLIARLGAIEVVGISESLRKSKLSVVIHVDGTQQWQSEWTGKPVRWQVDRRLPFRPSSTIKIDIVRKSKLTFKKPIHLGGSTMTLTRMAEDVSLDSTSESGNPIGVPIKVKLGLISTKEVMQDIDAAVIEGRNEAFGALSDYVAPLDQALSLIVKIMDTVSHAHPILKVSWTVLSSVFKAVQQQMLQDDAVRDLVESLREMVGVANKCPNLREIDGTTNVIEEIGRTSLQVATLIDEYSRLPFIGRTLKNQLSDKMTSRIQQCKQRCHDLIHKFDRRLAITTHEKLTNSVNDERRKQIYAWLSATVPSRNYDAALRQRVEGTGSWFINGMRFAEWKTNPDSFLWVYGDAGCGKTVLSALIIEDVERHCEADESMAYAYFFFDGRDSQSELQRHENLVRSIIRQLSAQYNRVPAALLRLYERCDSGGWQPSIDSLHITLQIIMDGFQHVFLAIDALDECLERKELLNWIESISQWKKGKLHLMATSRNEPDIERHLKPLIDGRVCMERSSVNHDIMEYIRFNLRTDDELKRWDADTHQNIIVKLMAKADGGFRWAALELRELRGCLSPGAMKDELQQLSANLDEFYNRIVSKLSKRNLEDVLKVVQWLAFAARPLNLEEIAEVVGVDLDVERGLRFDRGRLYPHHSVLDVCAGLVTHVDGEVKLAHFSVKEYLISKDRLHLSSGISISEKTSHSFIAQTCLAYLLQFSDIDALDLGSTITRYPLTFYATKYWVHHATSEVVDNSHGVQKLAVDFFQPRLSPAFVIWIRSKDFPSMERDSKGSSIYYASLYGFLDAVRALLAVKADIHASGGLYGNAIQAASYGGHLDVVKVLLEHEVDVGGQGGHYGNALQAASAEGHLDIVKVLLEHVADVGVQGGYYGEALQVASYGGHLDIVKVLLENGVDVGVQGGYYGNALQAASYLGRLDIVKVLLEHGADVGTQRGFFGNALQAASYGGHLDIVKVLLEHGADVGARGGEYGNALQAASYRGRLDIVKVLLEHGADVGTQGGEYGSALQAASTEGYLDIVEVLLERGADVGAQGGEYDSALQAASTGGHLDIVEVLLEHGADVGAQGGYFGNALQAASYGSHLDIVKVLLEHGADVGVQGGKYGNALQAASYGGHLDIVKMLLEHGADVSAWGGTFGSALEAATFLDHQEIIHLLLTWGSHHKL